MRSICLRLLMLVLMFGACSEALHAARLSERSPVRLGVWWDPAQSGNGFELFQGGEQTAVVWYTYRPDGSPVWYMAVAAFDAEGRWESTLYRHRWVDGARAAPTAVGRLRFERTHFEALVLHWSLDGREGTQNLEPFPVSGIVPEIDHTGAWFDPKRSGFGLSLTEQGEWLAAGLYFYDAAGEPTWRVGSNDGRGRKLVMLGTTGACPGCEPRATQRLDEGRLQLEFSSETALRANYAGAASAAWSLDGDLMQLSTPASRRPADRQLAGFDDATALRTFLDDALMRVSENAPFMGVDFSSPPPPSESFSTTNVQESGVDEADRLKSDGTWLYAIAKDPQGRDRSAVRVAEAREGGSQLLLHGEIALPESTQPIGYSGLYVAEDRLTTLQGTSPSGYGIEPLWLRPQAWIAGSTHVALFDRVSPSAPRALWKAEIDAHLVASRRIGERLYLVLRKTIAVHGFEFGSGVDAVRDERNRALLSQVPLTELLPRIRVGSGEWRALVKPEDVFLPVVGALLPSPQFITVVAIDLHAPDELRSLAVVGAVNAVYVSTERMYLATSRSSLVFDSQLGHHPSGFPVTDVHEIALGAQGPSFAATGAVEGYLDRDPDRAPFRFSERDGKLRVVSVGGPWRELGQNRLTVLERSTIAPGLLRTLSYLPNRDRPAPLGKRDEQLYATRFVGDRLYAVTFLKTDPLYVVDLSDPAAPRIAGALELPGFSDYLHPVREDVLLGIGLDARPAQSGWGDNQFAWFQGLLFSLFDVSDPSRPRLLQQASLGKRGSGSAILSNHHALSVLPGTNGISFALPVRVHEPDGSEPIAPPDNYSYPWSWSGLQKLEVTGSNASNARLVPGAALVTNRRSAGGTQTYPDDALYGARSIQFARGTVYFENGRFWRTDLAGTQVGGPH